MTVHIEAISQIKRLVFYATILIVLALIILSYVLLFLGESISALLAFLVAFAISLIALVVARRRNLKGNYT